MQSSLPDHYAPLGLDSRCSEAEIRAAYRILAKEHHPDVNPESSDATRIRILNAAYEVLGEPARRREYDRARAAQKKTARSSGKAAQNVSKEMHLRLEEFFRGTTLEVCVNDPGNPGGAETYELIVPPDTAPGTRFRLPRDDAFSGGQILVRVKAQPDFRFKIRGSDLRCDLKIRFQRAQQGGTESIRGVLGNFLRVPIPPNVPRGAIIRLPAEGLPRPRGGRGDLLVRILYAPEVQFKRSPRR